MRSTLKFAQQLPRVIDSVHYEKLSTSILNMGFFDILNEKEITTERGYIKKEPDEFVEDIQLSDRL